MFDNPAVLITVIIIIILVSMTLHEAMHAFVSYWLGDDTAKLEGRISLNPIRHIDPVLTIALPLFLIAGNILSGGGGRGIPIFGGAKPVPFNPSRVRFDEYGAALVGIAGPLTNLLLAVVAAGVLRLLGPVMGEVAVEVTLLFMRVNIGFFIFNMLPLPPLDGSRLLYAFAPEPVQNIMYQIERLGLLGLFLFLLVLFPLLQPILVTINNTLLFFLAGF